MDVPPPYDNEKDATSLEKGDAPEFAVVTDKNFHFDEHDLDRVQRRLKQRHVQMIAVWSPLVCASYTS